jgi:hypothetical protein
VIAEMFKEFLLDLINYYILNFREVRMASRTKIIRVEVIRALVTQENGVDIMQQSPMIKLLAKAVLQDDVIAGR